MSKLRTLDLFSGIGGFSLGLERTGGFKTVAFCEIEPFPRRVLAKHWPNVPIYEDVRELTAERLRADGIAVDVICGGFPCQDISLAGKGAGLNGERSGLWSEIARLASELRPRFVIVENVSALLGRGLDRVLGELASLGFDAEWHCIPAAAVGAHHLRDRFWLVAYPECERSAIRASSSGGSPALHDSNWQRAGRAPGWEIIQSGSRRNSQDVADTNCVPGAQQQRDELWLCWPADVAACHYRNRGAPDGNWFAEPDVGRVAHGVPSRVDRLRGLGNAVVPQIPELIGRAILSSMDAQSFPSPFPLSPNKHAEVQP